MNKIFAVAVLAVAFGFNGYAHGAHHVQNAKHHHVVCCHQHSCEKHKLDHKKHEKLKHHDHRRHDDQKHKRDIHHKDKRR